MFKALESKSTHLSLENVVKRLRANENIVAVFVAGSVSIGGAKPYSDYDLILIMDNKPEGLFSTFTYINNKIADIFYYSKEEIKKILSAQAVDQDNESGVLLSWLENGEIKFDKSGVLTDLKNKARSVKREISFSSKYLTWYKINYNFAQNSRYFNSGDKLYLSALDVRYLYSILEVFCGYFTLRDLPWRGEKEAIKYLKQNDQEFLNIFDSFKNENDKIKKFEFYKKLSEKSLGENIWSQDVVIIKPENNVSSEKVDELADFWNRLLNGK